MESQGQEALFRSDRFYSFSWWALHSRMLAPKTVQDRVTRLNHAHRAMRLAGLSLDQATEKQVRTYVDSLKPTAGTRNAARLALISYYTFLIESEAREDNPAASLPTWRPPDRMPRPLEDDEAQLLLKAAADHSPMMGCLITLYLYTGLRLSEVALRRWEDIAGRRLYLVAKGGRPRMVFLNSVALGSLQRWRPVCPSKVWMFPSDIEEGPVNRKWVWRRVRALGDSVGIAGCRAHRLRHTFAQKLYDETGQILLVQSALGHQNIQNTLIYARHSLTGVKEAVEQLTF